MFEGDKHRGYSASTVDSANRRHIGGADQQSLNFKKYTQDTHQFSKQGLLSICI